MQVTCRTKIREILRILQGKLGMIVKVIIRLSSVEPVGASSVNFPLRVFGKKVRLGHNIYSCEDYKG